MLKGIVTVGGWTMASRIMGFVRDILIAALAGTGPIADAFFIALRVPNLFRRLFGEGAFNAAFVPEFSGIYATEGAEPARDFAEQTIAVLAFWLLLLTVAGEIFMPQIMRLLAPGFADVPGKEQLTVALARITFPYVLLICLAALLSGVLNGLDRFAAAAAAPLVFNGVSIVAMLILTPYLPNVGYFHAAGRRHVELLPDDRNRPRSLQGPRLHRKPHDQLRRRQGRRPRRHSEGHRPADPRDAARADRQRRHRHRPAGRGLNFRPEPRNRGRPSGRPLCLTVFRRRAYLCRMANEVTLERGAMPIVLDRPRLVFYDMRSTWLLVQKYGDFKRALYTVRGTVENKNVELVLKDIEALQFFLWAGLQAECRRSARS